MKLHDLLDNTKCYEQIRQHRWPDGVSCPHCMSQDVTWQGKDDTQPDRPRYRCKSYQRRFDDLTLSVLSGHHQPLKVWVHCLYLMSLNLSNSQTAATRVYLPPRPPKAVIPLPAPVRHCESCGRDLEDTPCQGHERRTHIDKPEATGTKPQGGSLSGKGW